MYSGILEGFETRLYEAFFFGHPVLIYGISLMCTTYCMVTYFWAPLCCMEPLVLFPLHFLTLISIVLVHLDSSRRSPFSVLLKIQRNNFIMMNEEVTVTPSLDLDSKVISVIDQLTTKLDNVEVKVKDNHFNLKKSVMDLSEEVTGPGDDEHTGTTSGKRVKEEVPQLVSESTPIKRRRRNFDFSGLKKKKNPKGKQYFVEEIQGKHVSADGKVISYWIKWEKYSSKSNTWEPKDHIPQFIVDEFEHEFAKKRMMNLRTLFSAEVGQLPLGETAHIRIPTALGGTQYAEVKAICNADMNFDDKRVKKIHGVADTENGTRYFLVEFEDETTFVIEAEVMKWTFPQEVIRFYQSKIRWE